MLFVIFLIVKCIDVSIIQLYFI